VALVLILFGVAALTFFLVRLTPGDPVACELGKHMGDVATYRRLYHQMGLDRPLWQQFASYLWGVMHGDLGESVVLPGTPVTELIGSGLPVTLELGGLSTLVALLVGLPLGVLAAVRQNRLLADHLNMGLMMTLIALPQFVLIPLVWTVFGIALKDTIFHLPVSGWNGLGDPQYWIAPVAVFAAGLAGLFARSVRSFMLEELSRDYIRTARAKGLPRRVILYKHAFKNTLLPLASVLGPTVAFLVVGAFLVETMFGIPGLAGLTVQATLADDYAVTLGTTLLLAAAVVVVNALTDIIYAMVDPRVTL
jgi:ABC-type dipeptide/oligopeptide/nickel transport system permease component